MGLRVTLAWGAAAMGRTLVTMSNPLPQVLLDRLAAMRFLPQPLPESPMGLFAEWFDEAQSARRQPNPNCMTLATLSEGRGNSLAARVVLCRGMDVPQGYIVFFTNYMGRKGRELLSNPRAAVVFHWDHEDKQVRMEGPVVPSPAHESDDYFQSRPWESRLSAWASNQSQPLLAREDLVARVEQVISELGLDPNEIVAKGNAVQIPRPPHWGGFRLWCERVELWIGGPGRLHDRARWERTLTERGGGIRDVEALRGREWPEGYEASGWKVTRLHP